MSIKKIIHPMAGTIAMLCIGSFWLSTLVSELFLSQDAIVLVRHNILQTMWVMISAMAVTGGSGFALSGERKGNLLAGKKMRMQIIAANGLLILLPCAFYLYGKAAAGEMDLTFYALQIVGLVAGAANFSLMALNFRDGLKLSGRLRRKG
ncbi:hypothetical protein [Rhodoferax antarcticus]|uniref:Putative membrane protein n=1 Tax=Rhodoferax antarcticus ANT.BR TaxID=1111071 RepID=A0A1Q8YDY6_9BURK|nr:hypothetical protein [Rhodoferax antarcticus]OLP06205.1 putative membrane protein [Rhodoferax antarcticus ANT.BR]